MARSGSGNVDRTLPLIAEQDAEMFKIRAEQSGDAAAIHAVHSSSFPTSAEADLVERLRAAGRLSVSRVAEAHGQIVGHVAFSPVTADRASGGVGLAPVAVLELHRRHGIAADLIRAGLAACRESGFTWCVVLGEPAYYQRFGFRPAPAFGLTDEYGGGDCFQVLELADGAMPSGSGLIRYAPEFGVFA